MFRNLPLQTEIFPCKGKYNDRELAALDNSWARVIKDKMLPFLGTIENKFAPFFDATMGRPIKYIPCSYALSQNYPNPFNPTTTIGYELKAQSWVTLKVYNMLGQEVAAVIDRALIGAGKYTVMFEADELPAGLYIYRLTANNFVATQKMLLVK